MKTLFYFLTIFPLMFEMMVIADAKKYKNFFENIKKKESLDMTNKEKNYVILQALYFIWNIIGLLTDSWPLFALLFFLALILKKGNIFIVRLDAFLSFLILLFILINYFHLNINIGESLVEYLKSFF